MKPAQHTPGPAQCEEGIIKGWKLCVTAKAGDGNPEHEPLLCEMYDSDFVPLQERQANAELFAEAITIATETGLTPRQLAEQRKELIAELKRVRGILDQPVNHSSVRDANSIQILRADAALCRDLISAALAKCGKGAA